MNTSTAYQRTLRRPRHQSSHHKGRVNSLTQELHLWNPDILLHTLHSEYTPLRQSELQDPTSAFTSETWENSSKNPPGLTQPVYPRDEYGSIRSCLPEKPEFLALFSGTQHRTSDCMTQENVEYHRRNLCCATTGMSTTLPMNCNCGNTTSICTVWKSRSTTTGALRTCPRPAPVESRRIQAQVHCGAQLELQTVCR